jgi:hypothetical protein
MLEDMRERVEALIARHSPPRREARTWDELVRIVGEYIKKAHPNGFPWVFVGKQYYAQCRRLGQTVEALGDALEGSGFSILTLTDNNRRVVMHKDKVTEFFARLREEFSEETHSDTEIWQEMLHRLNEHYSTVYNLKRSRRRKHE